MTFAEWHESIWSTMYQVFKEDMSDERAAALALEMAALVQYARDHKFEGDEDAD